jgi:hypothetical protein
MVAAFSLWCRDLKVLVLLKRYYGMLEPCPDAPDLTPKHVAKYWPELNQPSPSRSTLCLGVLLVGFRNFRTGCVTVMDQDAITQR